MSDNVKEFSTDDFKSEVVESDTPVLVDFWAEWCGPCRVIAPVVEELANDYEGKVKFGKVNVDDHNQVASEYGVRSIPTLLIFKNGAVVNQIGCNKSEVYVCSTGVIGEYLNSDILISAIPKLVRKKSASWKEVAESICTTDTFIKGAKSSFKIEGKTFNIVGISKG